MTQSSAYVLRLTNPPPPPWNQTGEYTSSPRMKYRRRGSYYNYSSPTHSGVSWRRGSHSYCICASGCGIQSCRSARTACASCCGAFRSLTFPSSVGRKTRNTVALADSPGKGSIASKLPTIQTPAQRSRMVHSKDCDPHNNTCLPSSSGRVENRTAHARMFTSTFELQ